jgi:pimeloyl-ACP methyl ester carboxylesterase
LTADSELLANAPTPTRPNFTRAELLLPTGMAPVWSGGSGRPLLYLHSAGGLRIGAALTALAAYYRVVAPIFPGFDATPLHQGVGSMRGLADLTADIMKALFEEPCDVLGHSFGAWVATWLAVLHPELVDQLVLAAPAGFRPEGVGGLDQEPAALAAAMYAHPERLPPETKDPRVRAANRKVIDHYHGPEATDEPLAARLGEVRAPTLVLLGTKDGVTPPEAGRRLKHSIPNSYLTYIFDAAHVIEVDQPERFVRVVRDFLTHGEAFIINWKDGASAPTKA